MGKLGSAKEKLLHGNGIFMFLRSSVSSQIASWVDLGLGFILFSLAGLYPWLATGIGAVAGGIINCCINYKFTFHAKGVSPHAVAIKYIMVWTGSLLLNTYGTSAVYHLMRDTSIFNILGFTEDGCYATARISVSLIVSLAWNFLLQRYFVYRRVGFDSTIDKVIRLENKEKSTSPHT